MTNTPEMWDEQVAAADRVLNGVQPEIKGQRITGVVIDEEVPDDQIVAVEFGPPVAGAPWPGPWFFSDMDDWEY